MSWQRVRGHELLVQAFDRVVRRGRLAHAYLFTGPAGIGKRRFANELAKALLCEKPPADRLEACDQCSACAQVEAESHPDFFVVTRPEESLVMPIDAMRELSRNLGLKPVRGQRKIAIVDDADDLNDLTSGHAAANSFLKTLEEPAPGSLLILIGTDPDRQLSTIVSRCHLIRFAPLAPALIRELLVEQGVADSTLVERLARMSGGSLGQAVALAEPALWEFRQTLVQALTRPHFDSVALAQAWTRFVEEAGKESALQRRRAASTLRFLIDLLHATLRIALGATAENVEAEEVRPLRELAARLHVPQLLDTIDRAMCS